jgi:hypothetical protein
VRLCCGWRPPPPGRQPQASSLQKFLSTGSSALPLQQAKKPHGRGRPSLSQTELEKRGQKGKFFRRQKFALLHKKTE